MSQTSPFGGRRDFDLGNAAESATVDPYIARDYVANNLLHAADQACARVLISDMASDDALIVDNFDQFTTADVSSVAWLPVETFGPFPISTRFVDGVPVAYRLRCAIYASSSSMGQEVTCAIQAVPDGTMAAAWIRDTASVVGPENVVTFAPTLTTTPAWLAPDDDGVMTLNASALGTSTVVVDDVPSGVPTTLEYAAVWLRVIAYSPYSAGLRIYGIHVAEVL